MLMQEIKDLLENILVFELGFKNNILIKAQSLEDNKLVQLKNILLEVGSWQKKVLDKMAKEDPEFISRLENNKRRTEQELMSVYRQKLAEEDRKKMEIILGKISAYE